MFIARFYGLTGFCKTLNVSHVNQPFVNILTLQFGNLIFAGTPTELPLLFLIFAALTISQSKVILNGMTKEKLAEYKSKLEKERMLILAEIKNSEKPTDFGSDIDHGDEESDQTEELGNQLAVAEDLKLRLDDIEAALEKIQIGKYGICEKCGKEIEEEVLNIVPESRLCKSDKLSA